MLVQGVGNSTIQHVQLTNCSAMHGGGVAVIGGVVSLDWVTAEVCIHVLDYYGMVR